MGVGLTIGGAAAAAAAAAGGGDVEWAGDGGVRLFGGGLEPPPAIAGGEIVVGGKPEGGLDVESLGTEGNCKAEGKRPGGGDWPGGLCCCIAAAR